MPDALPKLDEECFFIAPIGDDGSSVRDRSDNVLEFIVGAAAQELGLIAVRGDQIAEPGQITLQIIDHILGARAAVADLTGLNPNVFYELAVRHTARLPVALIAEKDCKLPFDIAQMRTIFFEHTNLRSVDRCKKEIVAQLGQALHGGAVNSPVATSIDVRALAGGSIAERNIAEIVTTIEEVARSQQSAQDQGRDFVERFSYEMNEILTAVRADNERFIVHTARESRDTMQWLVEKKLVPLIDQLNTMLAEFRKHQKT
jgi:hypothetical protein